MRILIGCEQSDAVRSQFEKQGFDAWSCDILPNKNEKAKHIQGDIFEALQQQWDAFICFPPCTHLAISGAPWFKKKQIDGTQQKAIEFFLKLTEQNIKHIAIENPIGIMSKIYRKPDQIIQPYYFGDAAQKSTCLWLKNLPLLIHNNKPNLFNEEITWSEKGEFFYWTCKKTGKQKKQALWHREIWNLPKQERGHKRSITFPGIAAAMGKQWGEFLKFQHV